MHRLQFISHGIEQRDNETDKQRKRKQTQNRQRNKRESHADKNKTQKTPPLQISLLTNFEHLS